jgi:hypothetical protein
MSEVGDILRKDEGQLVLRSRGRERSIHSQIVMGGQSRRTAGIGELWWKVQGQEECTAKTRKERTQS